ncbi:alginate O-acetyltransferase AlgX-related protein [Tundrisphaera lichenicola]|uniref:alginate O-acetyltransferase AlgX-related protein n=1 Tax=Tundrisphaera lichenicola TaxID=2029860 RepID=UPI003EB7714A
MTETQASYGRGTKTADRVLIAVFLTAICLPAADTIFHLDPTPHNMEHAPRKRLPRLEPPVSLGSIRQYLRSWKVYLPANFGFRRILLRACNMAELRMFGRFSTPVVLHGQSGWLVYGSGLNLGAPWSLSVEGLENWRSSLEWRRDWCRARGLPYLLVLVPGPQTIYPETYPSFLTDPPPASRLDQVISYLSEKSDLEILDLRGPLKEARSLGRLYQQTDTHWNDLGAYVGYREIMKRLARWLPGLEATPIDDFDRFEESRLGGDLAGIIGLRDVFGEESGTQLLPRLPRRASYPEGSLSTERMSTVRKMPLFATGVTQSSMPRAFIIRDSFTTAMIPFLAEHFSRIVFFWRDDHGSYQYFPADFIERESPDVVIDEFAENMIWNNTVPKNVIPPGSTDGKLPAPD